MIKIDKNTSIEFRRAYKNDQRIEMIIRRDKDTDLIFQFPYKDLVNELNNGA